MRPENDRDEAIANGVWGLIVIGLIVLLAMNPMLLVYGVVIVGVILLVKDL